MRARSDSKNVAKGNAAYATTRVVDNVEVANEYIGPMKWNQ